MPFEIDVTEDFKDLTICKDFASTSNKLSIAKASANERLQSRILKIMQAITTVSQNLNDIEVYSSESEDTGNVAKKMKMDSEQKPLDSKQKPKDSKQTTKNNQFKSKDDNRHESKDDNQNESKDDNQHKSRINTRQISKNENQHESKDDIKHKSKVNNQQKSKNENQHKSKDDNQHNLRVNNQQKSKDDHEQKLKNDNQQKSKDDHLQKLKIDNQQKSKDDHQQKLKNVNQQKSKDNNVQKSNNDFSVDENKSTIVSNQNLPSNYKSFDNLIDELFSLYVPKSQQNELDAATVCNRVYGDEAKEEHPVIIKDKYRKRNQKGETVLHSAVHRNRISEVKEILANAQFLVNAMDNASWTPLHDCIDKSNFEVARVLIEAGASVNAPGADYVTPMMLAVKANVPKIAELLLEYGADIKAIDYFGRVALNYASQENRSFFEQLFNRCTKIHAPIEMINATTVHHHHILWHDFDNAKVRSIFASCKSVRHTEADLFTLHNRMSSEITHLVTSTVLVPCRHLLAAVLSGVSIVNPAWFKDVVLRNKMLAQDNYEYSNMRTARLAIKNNIPRLFDGIVFFVLSHKHDKIYSHDGVAIGRKTMIELIKLGGGSILRREPTPSMCSLEGFPWHLRDTAMQNCSTFIVYPSDCRPLLCYNMAELKHVSANFIVNSIMQYRFDCTQINASN